MKETFREGNLAEWYIWVTFQPFSGILRELMFFMVFYGSRDLSMLQN